MTNNIVCSSCGGAGHIAKDCTQRRPGMGFGQQQEPKNKMDDEVRRCSSYLRRDHPNGDLSSTCH